VKWGYALQAFDELGHKYEDGLPVACVQGVRTEVLKRDDVERFVAEESAKAARFARELNVNDPCLLADVTKRGKMDRTSITPSPGVIWMAPSS
jgi:hypothetical protein